MAACLKERMAPVRLAENIYSAVADGSSRIVYDKHAALYDRLIGNTLYNRIAWGTSPESYARFAQIAARSGDGVLLDAGCGSLVSTAEMHVNSGRPTILCDLSTGMLAAARDRIMKLAGGFPDHLVLLQADLRQLPFRDGSFGAVLCPGMLHIFDDVEAVTAELARVSAPKARLHMSSLVAERWIGTRYLHALHRAGEVAIPRSARQLLDRLEKPTSGLAAPLESRLEGSMLFLFAQKTGGSV